MGRQLAIEHPADADLIVPVPDSGVAAASLAMQRVWYQLPTSDHPKPLRWSTFIEPSQSIRSFGVRLKLNPEKT
jgi:amidophosphoribosyltransferase